MPTKAAAVQSMSMDDEEDDVTIAVDDEPDFQLPTEQEPDFVLNEAAELPEDVPQVDDDDEPAAE